MHREAKEKTGKYVLSFLDHLKKHLGVHAVVFVAYQDEEDKVKISE
jgi:GH25 family lysozyme M1 (1,4-beta-N-acetylmuramidase)